jgi:hypothetical protein
MPTVIRIRIAYTVFILTYWNCGWPLSRAFVGAMFVFRLHTEQLSFVYTSSFGRFVNRQELLNSILDDGDGGINGGRVSVALLMIACWYMRGYVINPGYFFDLLDNACVKARSKRAAELIL